MSLPSLRPRRLERLEAESWSPKTSINASSTREYPADSLRASPPHCLGRLSVLRVSVDWLGALSARRFNPRDQFRWGFRNHTTHPRIPFKRITLNQHKVNMVSVATCTTSPASAFVNHKLTITKSPLSHMRVRLPTSQPHARSPKVRSQSGRSSSEIDWFAWSLFSLIRPSARESGVEKSFCVPSLA